MALLTLLSPWFSPAAAWFIFFNAVVGAIAVMSASGAQAGQAAGATSSSQRRLCRSGSSSMGLDRLRSFFVFPVGQLPVDESSAASASHFCSREAEAAAAAATLVCAPAERSPQAVVDARTGESEKAAIRAAQPSAPVAMATPEEEDKAEAEEEQDHDESISLDEAYALAQRHREKPLKSPPPPAAASATTAPAALPTPEHKKKPAKVVVADWRRVPKAGEAQLEGKAELNARAELFIRQFREDLRLQRLNSILKHTHALGSPTAAR